LRRPCAQTLVLGGLLAALLALVAIGAEGQRLAQAQGRQPDATSGKASDAARIPPLKWLNYSSERFHALMRMLAARAAPSEDKPTVDAKPVEDARRAAEAKAADDARRAEEAGRAAEAKAAEEAKRAAEAGAAGDARRAREAKRAAEAKAAEEARAGEVAKVAAEARRAAQDEAAEAAKRAADAHKALAITQADKAADAGKAGPAAEPGRRAPAACPNAGRKVAGAGWYVVRSGDSLWRIARVHYGYGRRWRRIHAANRRTIANPRRIYPCQRIYIPRSRLGESALQGLRAALQPFIRRRAIDGGLPGLVD
jgi:nucleoid-associated protein YgaU